MANLAETEQQAQKVNECVDFFRSILYSTILAGIAIENIQCFKTVGLVDQVICLLALSVFIFDLINRKLLRDKLLNKGYISLLAITLLETMALLSLTTALFHLEYSDTREKGWIIYAFAYYTLNCIINLLEFLSILYHRSIEESGNQVRIKRTFMKMFTNFKSSIIEILKGNVEFIFWGHDDKKGQFKIIGGENISYVLEQYIVFNSMASSLIFAIMILCSKDSPLGSGAYVFTFSVFLLSLILLLIQWPNLKTEKSYNIFIFLSIISLYFSICLVLTTKYLLFFTLSHYFIVSILYTVLYFRNLLIN